MIRNCFFACILLIGFACQPLMAQQLTSVTIGVDGLHCSACSFSVEKSLRKVDFVEYVQMDLNERKAEVVLKKETTIDYRKLADAVRDAGFSVRDFYLRFDQTLSISSSCVELSSGNLLCLGQPKTEAHRGETVQLLGKPFLAKSVFKKWKKDGTELNCLDCSETDHFYFAVIK